MRRALGISNATWVGGGLAVRIANTPLVDDMAAEVALVRALPPEVGHPKILGVGTIEFSDAFPGAPVTIVVGDDYAAVAH